MTALSYEDGFHLRLGRLTQAATTLDVNVGFALERLAKKLQRDVTMLLDSKKDFARRLNELQKLVKQEAGNRDQPVHEELTDWLKSAKALRALRNNYVHARWSMCRVEIGAMPFVEYVPFTLVSDPTAIPAPKRVTFDEFDQQISELQRLSTLLTRLLEKHCDV